MSEAMQLGLVGEKCGMTRVFTDNGEAIPVTVIQATPNRITQLKTQARDGYSAVQVTVGSKRANLINKPQGGHFKQANVEPGLGLWELRPNTKLLNIDANKMDAALEEQFPLGGEVTVDTFTEGQVVDVTGISKGKGFAGAVKRHNFRTQDATHGNSLSHRAPGSIGQNQTPGRVFKGKKMAGHLGAERQTSLNLQIVKIDAERHLIFVKGSVPGAPGGIVMLKPSVKTKTKKGA